jgi:hypothetical protein
VIPVELRARIEAALADPSLPADLRANLRRWLSPIVPGDPADVREQINRALARVSAGRTALQATTARTHLGAQRERLITQGGSGLATADEILDSGTLGIRFFDLFLPLYDRCEGVPYFGSALRMSVADLKARYNAERGLRLASFRTDGEHVTSARGRLDGVNDVLDDAGLQLASIWEGPAAREALGYYRRFSLLADQLRRQVGTAGEAVLTAMATVESVIFDKVRSVLSLYRETSGGFDAAAVETIIEVALGAEHGWGELLTWFGESGRGDSGRRLAQRVSQRWLQSVFKPDLEMQVRLFLQACDSCRRGIREAFALVEVALASIPPDPFRALPHRVEPAPPHRRAGAAPRRASAGDIGRPIVPPGTAHVGSGVGTGVSGVGTGVRASSADSTASGSAPPRTGRLASHPTQTLVAPVSGVRVHRAAVAAASDSAAPTASTARDSAAPFLADARGLVNASDVDDVGGRGEAPALLAAATGTPSASIAPDPQTTVAPSPTIIPPESAVSGSSVTAPTAAANVPTAHGGVPGFAMPLIPANRSGPREAHRKYRIPGDLVGAEDLARWDDLRPVLGEEL